MKISTTLVLDYLSQIMHVKVGQIIDKFIRLIVSYILNWIKISSYREIFVRS
jgi:hypothetical protein